MPFDYMEKIPLLSFFTGGGFLDMGFELTGNYKIVWTNECDPIFAHFYESGFSSWIAAEMNQNDRRNISNLNKLQEISADQIIEEAFGKCKPDFFGMVGGPPCQDFSNMGKKNGFNGDRGQLTKEYLLKIEQLQPSFFVMENVAGLIHVKKTRLAFLEKLEKLRHLYLIDHFILNALHYGTPQSRERVFVIGIQKKFVNQDDFSSSCTKGWFDQPQQAYPDALTWSVPKPTPYGSTYTEKLGDIPLHLCVESCLIPDDQLHTIPNANEYFQLHTSLDKLQKINEGETNRASFKRLHRYKYSPTVCYGNNEVHLHPYKNRRLSVREALRLQGVPDSYVLPSSGRFSKKFKMIGNGVPVPLAKAVAEALFNFLLKSSIVNENVHSKNGEILEISSLNLSIK